jgi:acetylornithine deacetylase
MNNAELHQDAIDLLKQLVATPSFSKEEHNTAALIESFLNERGIETHRHLNNIWARNKHYDESKPTILLNSHHDTVKPNRGYTIDPFNPIEKDGKLFGLGSNDAGGSLVSIISVFVHFHAHENLKYNLVLGISAEEEISGKNGVEALLTVLPRIDCGIVSEPTLLQMAIAERGLMVLDCVAHGRAGHAARNEGDNAIYKAMADINWIHGYRFQKVSEFLGPVKITVTSIETENKAHNVVPPECKFVVDVRINELYTHEEAVEIIEQHIQSTVHMRSDRLRSTKIELTHPLVQAGLKMGRSYYGSPTCSDKALMSFPALKIGPGDSARSHTADEFIFVDEIRQGIDLYITILNEVTR